MAGACSHIKLYEVDNTSNKQENNVNQRFRLQPRKYCAIKTNLHCNLLINYNNHTVLTCKYKGTICKVWGIKR